ncbi:MAG: hypothetical protein ACOVNU_14625 [Candidatus Kapaibacteriota bacterium]|jgi:hypothetical protein
MAIYVLVNEIIDGMILSEPIVNNFGQTLLPFGAILSEKHIRIFRTWNITGVMIKSDQDDDTELSPELQVLARERLRKRMGWLPRNAIEKDLVDMAVIKLIKMNKVN